MPQGRRLLAPLQHSMQRIIALLSIAQCAAFSTLSRVSSGGSCIDEPDEVIAEEAAKLGAEYAEFKTCAAIYEAGGCERADAKAACCATCSLPARMTYAGSVGCGEPAARGCTAAAPAATAPRGSTARSLARRLVVARGLVIGASSRSGTAGGTCAWGSSVPRSRSRSASPRSTIMLRTTNFIGANPNGAWIAFEDTGSRHTDRPDPTRPDRPEHRRPTTDPPPAPAPAPTRAAPCSNRDLSGM